MMKVLVPFLALGSMASATTATTQYMDFNATNDNSTLALCGTNLWGCVAVPESSRGCGESHPQLGALAGIGSDAQTWEYHEGMLQTRLPHASYWGYSSDEPRCLGIRAHGSSSLIDDGRSYPLTVQKCSDDSRFMRFVFVDGRIESLAPYSGQVPFCMTIEGDVAMQSAGSRLSFQPCDASNRMQQAMEPYGHVKPFLYSTQPVFGYEDSIELAFQASTSSSQDDDTPIIVLIYNQANPDEPVHSMEISGLGGVVTLDASVLLLLVPPEDLQMSGGGDFVAELGELRVEFSISQQEQHIAVCDDGYWGGFSFVIGLAAVAALCCICLFIAYSHTNYNNSDIDSTDNMMLDEDKTVTSQADQDDLEKTHLEKTQSVFSDTTEERSDHFVEGEVPEQEL